MACHHRLSACGLLAWLVFTGLTLPGSADEPNLLPNGSFEDGTASWRLSDGAPKFERMGSGRVVTDHVAEGSAAFHYEKTVPEIWYPQLWSAMVPVKEKAFYEASFLIDSDQPFVFRYTLRVHDSTVKFSESREPTNEWQRVAVKFQTPAGTSGVQIGLQMVDRKGEMWIDDARLIEIPPFENDAPGIILEGPPADKIHGLEELAARTRISPTELRLRDDGSYGSERLVFRDSATGATIWKMSRNPGYNRHRYSNMPVWNADGSKLALSSDRDRRGGHWLVEADGSRWQSLGTAFAQWNRADPDLAYWTRSADGEIHETNIATGESRLLWKLPIRRFSFVPPSHDGKKLLLVENAQSRTAERSYAYLLNADGSGEPRKFDLGTVAHQTWFLKRDDYSFMFNDEVRNTRNLYRDHQWICNPAADGAIRVLDAKKHFTHAGVSPSGNRVAHHRSGICITEIDSGEMWRSMIGRGGHLSWECDDRWLVATMGNNIFEVWVDRREARRICVPNTQLGYSTYHTEAHLESSPDGTKIGYASSMMGDCDFYVAVERLPDAPNQVRREGAWLAWEAPEHAKELAGYLVYDGQTMLTPEPIQETRFRLPRSDGDYVVTAIEHCGLESPRPDEVAPDRPKRIAGRSRSPYAIELAWQECADADFAHYHVYASREGSPAPVQARRVASPTAPRLLDWGLQAGTTYRYVVTAVDRMGNESQPSQVVAVHTPSIRRVFERVEVDEIIDSGGLTVSFSVPHSDTYLLWAELEPIEATLGAPISYRLDGRRNTWRPMWDLVCIGHGEPNPVPFFDTLKHSSEVSRWEPRFPLAGGNHELTLSTERGKSRLVSLTVTNDQGYVPQGITSFLAARAE